MEIERRPLLFSLDPDPGDVYRTYLRGTSEGGEPGIDPGRIRAFVRRRFLTILVGFLAVMVTVTVITFLLPRSYESSASFLVEQPRQSARMDVPALDVLERVGQLASRETETALIQSRRVVEPVVDEGNLHVSVKVAGEEKPLSEVFASMDAGADARAGTYEIRRSEDGLQVVDAETGETLATGRADEPLKFADIAAGPILPASLPGLDRDPLEVTIVPFAQAVNAVQKRISVAAVQRDADLLDLKCKDETPEKAQELCAAVSASYLTLRAELQHAEATSAASFLSGQAKSVQVRLAAAEDSLRGYAEKSQAVALDTRAAEEVRRNAEIWAEREQLVAERASLEALTREIEGDPSRGTERFRDFASFPTFLKNQNQIVTRLVESLVELDTRRNDLAVRRSDADVELKALDSRIADVEEQLRSTAVGYTEALTAQIASLDNTLRNSRAVIAAIPAQQVETARLNRQVSLLNDLYSFLQTRLQEAQLAQAIELPSVRVVDRASLPFRPSSPNRRLNLALGFLLACSTGLMGGLWKEYSDTRIRERKALQQESGIPVLSMVPALKHPGPVIAMKRVGSNGDAGVELVPQWTAERALALEAFRTLSADLGFVGRNLESGDGIHTVAVTSSTRGEGKTFTACNLAITRASHGVRTLLVDGDLKGKGVSRFLELSSDLPGLTDLMTGDGDLGAFMQTFEVSSGRTLFVVPAGAETTRSAELLESERFRAFLRSAQQKFELVVIDTPPLNVVTDAAAVAASTDAVLLVVRGGYTERAALDHTLERLHRIGAQTAGIVMNDVELPSAYRSYTHAD